MDNYNLITMDNQKINSIVEKVTSQFQEMDNADIVICINDITDKGRNILETRVSEQRSLLNGAEECLETLNKNRRVQYPHAENCITDKI